MLVRTVKDGGEAFYVKGRHSQTIPSLWTAINAEERRGVNEDNGIRPSGRKIAGFKGRGKKIVHCHGCFDLMHPGHIKHFQAAKKMGTCWS